MEKEASISGPVLGNGFSLTDYIGQIRSDLMEQALEKSNGNKSQAARFLGIKPQAVHQYFDKKTEREEKRGKREKRKGKKK